MEIDNKDKQTPKKFGVVRSLTFPSPRQPTTETNTKRLRMDEQATRTHSVVKYWNIDENTRVYASPLGICVIGGVANFTLTREEWQELYSNWRRNGTPEEVILSNIKGSWGEEFVCSVTMNNGEAVLRRYSTISREKCEKLQLSREQFKALDRRATYITDHVELLYLHDPVFEIMYEILAGRMKNLTLKLDKSTCEWYVDSNSLETIYANFSAYVSPSHVTRSFEDLLKLRQMTCEFSSYSMYNYCLLQMKEIRKYLM